MDSSFHQLNDAKARALHLLTCALCSKHYEDPRVLPCQHTFCHRCLSAHVNSVQSACSTRLGAFACPQCNADVGLPAAGASAFPVDQRIRNIRELFVEEMAKDLASRFKERQRGDNVSNGSGAGHPGDDVHSHRHGNVYATTRLGDISERPDSDGAGLDFGTWPSSARAQQLFGDESAYRTPATDSPVFSRRRPGYSSMRGAARRTFSHDSPLNYDDARFETSTFSDLTQTTGGKASPDTGGRFSNNSPGYSSMRIPRSRHTRMGLADNETMFDGITRAEGRTTSSSSFSNGHAASQTQERKNSQRSSSHVDVSSKSSPFDNINRDDDLSETSYTPIIGRHRFAYSSLRERRQRPLFDPHQLYDNPADFADGDLSSSDGFGRFSGAAHNRHAGVPSQTSEFVGNLRRTVSSDLNWTRHTSSHAAREQRPPGNNRDFESDQVRRIGREYTATGEHTPARQRADSLDTSVLTVLSNLPADVKTRVTKSTVSECDATSTGDHSQSQTEVNQNHASASIGHRITPSESLITSSTTDEVRSTTHTQNDIASQVNKRCRVDLDKTGDIASSEHTEPSTSYSTDSCKDTSASNDPFHQADSRVINIQCSVSEDPRYSPPRSPNESRFSRLTKFRWSKNSKQIASSTKSSSAADSTSKEPESSSHDADSSAVHASRSRVRRRPPAFLGTPCSFPASDVGKNTQTSPPADVRNDELSSEYVSSKRQSELRPLASVSGSTADDVCFNVTSFAGDVKGSETATDVDDSRTCSSDVSPTAEISISSELPPSVESDDVQSSADDFSATALQRHDEDSAVYSAGVDSDASVTSAVEPCLPTPTTDNDVDLDDVPVNCAADESVSTRLSDQQDAQTSGIRRRLENNDCVLTTSESHSADGTMTDFNVERHLDDAELIKKDRGADQSEAVENGDARDADSSGRSSSECSVPDELHHQNGQRPQTDDDDVNENDVTATEKNEFCDNGHTIQSDDVTDDRCVLATGVSALGDRSLVVADYGAGCVRMCDDEGRTEHRVTGIKPFSVATSTSMIASDDDELIYVGDRRRKTLVVLDRHGSDVAQWPDNQFDWICGIAHLPDGQLAVLDRSRTRQLGIYSASGDDGRPLTELGGQGSSLGDLCMAEFIAADSLGRVLVSDSGNHCVKAFDHRVARPGVVAVYGTARGGGDAQLEWPKGVAVDSAGNVLVADCRNGRVVAFSVDGRSLGNVVPAVRGPYAICTMPISLCNRRRMAVTTYSVSGISEFRFYDYDTDAIFV